VLSSRKLAKRIMRCKSYPPHTVTVGLNPDAEDVAEPAEDELVETLLEDVKLAVEETVPLVLVDTVVEGLLDADVEVRVVAAVDELDDVELLELELVTDVLVVSGALVAVPPQIMFIDTAIEVAYIVGLAPELAADEA
jgi:hypothetical protein